jgi:hypothetical protein
LVFLLMVAQMLLLLSASAYSHGLRCRISPTINIGWYNSHSRTDGDRFELGVEALCAYQVAVAAAAMD